MTDPDYFTLAELRALPDMSDATRYPDATALLRAAEVVGIIEREVGTSFVARQVTDEPHDGGYYAIPLRVMFALDGTVSANEDGAAVTDDLVVRSGVLRRFSPGNRTDVLPWNRGIGNVLVTYSAGYSTEPPPDIKAAAMKATRARLLEQDSQAGIEDRRTSMTNEMGTTTFVVAGEKRPTGYPDVDAVILGWKARLDVGGFA